MYISSQSQSFIGRQTDKKRQGGKEDYTRNLGLLDMKLVIAGEVKVGGHNRHGVEKVDKLLI